VILRRARREDVPAIVGLLQEDFLGAERETPKGEPLPDSYAAAFDAIDRNPDVELTVAEDGGKVLGCFQSTVLTYLSYRGSKALLIENVHVAESARNKGVGREMMLAAIARAKETGCSRAQLTTNKKRADAHRFYERLGFRATHEGMKLTLP
jgi:ribosomal protein S18 acetylase RimI-like enzyme